VRPHLIGHEPQPRQRAAQRQARACQPAPAPARIEERDVCGHQREVPDQIIPADAGGTSAAAPADSQQTSPRVPAPDRPPDVAGKTLRLLAAITGTRPPNRVITGQEYPTNFCSTTGTPRKGRPGCRPADRGIPARGFTGAN
jgi:hypothetical protein